MNVEYLPFFEDEFFLRATNHERWEALVSALQDLRAENDPETNNRGISGLLRLLAAASGEQQGDEDLIPILARRFARDVEQLRTDRGASALLALQSAVNSHQWKEDCPSLNDCGQKDAFRQRFIREGKWVDTNVAYEHLLQRAVEKEEAKRRSAVKKHQQMQLLQTVILVPCLVLLPVALFFALIVTGITSSAFSESFATAVAVLFSIEAFVVWMSFSLVVANEFVSDIQSSRVLAAVASLVLCVVSLVISLQRPVPLGGSRFIGGSSCVPLALAQLFVIGINASLLVDYGKLRQLSRNDAEKEFSASVKGVN